MSNRKLRKKQKWKKKKLVKAAYNKERNSLFTLEVPVSMETLRKKYGTKYVYVETYDIYADENDNIMTKEEYNRYKKYNKYIDMLYKYKLLRYIPIDIIKIIVSYYIININIKYVKKLYLDMTYTSIQQIQCCEIKMIIPGEKISFEVTYDGLTVISETNDFKIFSISPIDEDRYEKNKYLLVDSVYIIEEFLRKTNYNYKKYDNTYMNKLCIDNILKTYNAVIIYESKNDNKNENLVQKNYITIYNKSDTCIIKNNDKMKQMLKIVLNVVYKIKEANNLQWR